MFVYSKIIFVIGKFPIWLVMIDIFKFDMTKHIKQL